MAEQGLAYWRRYLLAFALMGVAAATTAGSAYLLGEVINKAYVDRDVRGIAILSLVTIVIFTLKGAATYGHTVILSQIGNAILANNQRQLFAKLMSENIAFFSERHSSEFLARLTAGATSVTQVLNLLINAIGRDLLSLIALVVVMLMTDPDGAARVSAWRRRRCWCCASSSSASRASRITSSPAPPTSWRPCRNRCRASAP